jgi:hypothetical protein
MPATSRATTTALRVEASVPIRMYSANSRRSSCLNLAKPLAARITAITAKSAPATSTVRMKYRSRMPMTRPALY